MIIIGELLNSSRQKVEEAFLRKDRQFILDLAIQQEKAGCSYLNLNTTTLMDKETEALSRAISVIEPNVSIPLSISSSSSEALAAALQIHQKRALLNSLSGKKEGSEEIIALIREFNPEVIVSCWDDNGIPDSPQIVVKIADKIINRLFQQTSLTPEDIFLDPVLRPLKVVPDAAKIFLESVMLLKKEFPGIKLIAALSNISYGLPKRKLVNHAFLSSLVGHGIAAVIADPLQPYFWPLITVNEFINNCPGAEERFLEWAASCHKIED